MIGVLFLLQVVGASQRPESVYSSPALASFIAAAAIANRTPPPSLRGYHARVESELSLLLRDTLGRERVAQVEQLAMTAQWRLGDGYDLRVIGYRSESVGVPYSALSLARSWTIPSLYGNRLTLGVDVARMGASERGPPKSKGDSIKTRPRSQPLRAIHPLAFDRERFYRFSGGDTIAFLRSRGRVVPIARVRVTPVFDSAARAERIGAFDGEIDFDASRHQIVRMRGQFVTTAAPHSRRRIPLGRIPGLVAVAYVEFVNAEVEGQFWLPEFQRTEFQATFAPLGTQRSVFRLVSQFSNIGVDAAHAAALTDTAAADNQAAPPSVPNAVDTYNRVLSYASGDSISRYDDWIKPLGSATSNVHSSDFDDLSPDAWRTDGSPLVDVAPAKLDEIFRFDRIEGAYVGAAAGVRFRDAVPGLTTHVYAGWAFDEETPRGGASLRYDRGNWTTIARVDRALATTNDFAAPLEGGSIGFAGLIGVDDQDYIDRRTAAVGLTRTIGSIQTALITAEAGISEDRRETARLSHGVFGAGSFRINRGSTEGRYVRAAATLELHPDVTGLFLEPGAGLTASYEIGRGDLNWQRAELALAVRRSFSDVVIAGRAQGGIVLGRDLPPQQLFELGGEGALPGYRYKEFAGDRAAMAGVLASYGLPVLRRPWSLGRGIVLPGLSPGFAVGVQSGWTEASTAGARSAIQLLDPESQHPCGSASTQPCPPALSRPTNGARATVDARLTLLGGLLGFGVARAVDQAAPWRFVFRFGQEY
jgi:hypothetical protein